MESAGPRPCDVGEPFGPQQIVGATSDGATFAPSERAPPGLRLPRPTALGAAGAATATAALRRTRTAMVRELQRMSAVGEAVERDSVAIDASRQRHAEYAGAVQDSHAKISAYQVRARAFVCVHRSLGAAQPCYPCSEKRGAPGPCLPPLSSSLWL